MVETQVSQRDIVRKVVETFSDPTQRPLYKNRPDSPSHYQRDDGKKCAVGLFMTEEALELHGLSTKNIEALSLKYGLNELLKEEYQGHPVLFWSNLQKFRDAFYF